LDDVTDIRREPQTHSVALPVPLYPVLLVLPKRPSELIHATVLQRVEWWAVLRQSTISHPALVSAVSIACNASSGYGLTYSAVLTHTPVLSRPENCASQAPGVGSDDTPR